MSRIAPVMPREVSAYGMKTAACSLQKRSLPMLLEELIPANLTAVNTSSYTSLAAHILFDFNHVSGMVFVQVMDLLQLWRLFQFTEGEGSKKKVGGSGANILPAFYCFVCITFLPLVIFLCLNFSSVFI